MMVEQLQQAKLVLLGEMGSGKTSLVQRYVRGHYYENQVRFENLNSFLHAIVVTALVEGVKIITRSPRPVIR